MRQAVMFRLSDNKAPQVGRFVLHDVETTLSTHRESLPALTWHRLGSRR